MRLAFKEIEQSKIVDIYINWLKLDIPEGKMRKLKAMCTDLMNHWAAETVITKSDTERIYESSYLRPISNAVHDHNASINGMRYAVSKHKSGSISDDELYEALERTIKKNQDTFDTAYSRYKDTAILDKTRLKFSKKDKE